MKNRTENSLLELFGDRIGLTKSNGRLVLHTIKRRKRTRPTEKQQNVNNKFIMAAAYSKSQMNDPERKALYSEGITKTKQTAYVVAMSDALNAPVVHEIDTSNYTGAAGDIISIHATDDFEVVRVEVVITNQNGNGKEIGEASQQEDHPFRWNYSPRVLHRDLDGITISVTAFDNPGNQATLEKVLEQSFSSPKEAIDKRESPKTQRRNRPIKKSINH